MKKAFIALSFDNKDELVEEVEVISLVLKNRNYETVVFVNDFSFPKNFSDKKMMDAALSEISDSDILIAELSHKAVGVGLEIGYAKALSKKIIYVRKEDAEYSKTAGGVSDEIVTYLNANDLKLKLMAAI